MRTLAVLCLAGLLTACGGGDSSVVNKTKTIGEELQDLDKAYKDGLITEKQYRRAKKRVLRGD